MLQDIPEGVGGRSAESGVDALILLFAALIGIGALLASPLLQGLPPTTSETAAGDKPRLAQGETR